MYKRDCFWLIIFFLMFFHNNFTIATLFLIPKKDSKVRNEKYFILRFFIFDKSIILGSLNGQSKLHYVSGSETKRDHFTVL